MKKCARCGRTLPLDNFYRNSLGGFSARCKGCHSVEVRTCLHCGKEFLGKHGKRVCSPECRKAHWPPTYKICSHCMKSFVPGRLARRFCSMACKIKAQTTGRRCRRKTHTQARNAQSLVRYHVQAGHITRPSVCEECGATGRKIEAAHFNYAEPLRVRWLCISCHRRWDRRQPKGATVRVPLDQTVPSTEPSPTPKATTPPSEVPVESGAEGRACELTVTDTASG